MTLVSHSDAASVLQRERLNALGQLAGGIAHDINNAISPIALYAEGLLEAEPGLSARGRRQIQVIARAIDDVASTVARLREFARGREDNVPPAPLNLNRLVGQVLELTRANWSDLPQQRGIRIELREDMPAIPDIPGVEGELRDAITNLVLNAVDAMPRGGVLTVATRVVDGGGVPRVRLEVGDTGTGMDEETRRRCLEPFFTTKGERGTGLGLAMVYGVAQRHGATIAIDSAPGSGTAVSLAFPVSPVTESGPPPAPRPDAVPARPLRVLVVDDDELLLRTLCEMLGASGHMASGAPGGAEGLRAFEGAQAGGRPFDAVITDLGMPGMGGRQVAEAVKAVSPATPVILLTGWGHSPGDEGEVPPHVDAVLGKPARIRELRAVLARCTEGMK